VLAEGHNLEEAEVRLLEMVEEVVSLDKEALMVETMVGRESVLEGEEAFEDEQMVAYWGVAWLGVHGEEVLDKAE